MCDPKRSAENPDWFAVELHIDQPVFNLHPFHTLRQRVHASNAFNSCP
jgi:predicted RNA-binding protein with PUA-like domain